MRIYKRGQRIPGCCVQNKYMLYPPDYLSPPPPPRSQGKGGRLKEKRSSEGERVRERQHGWRLFGLCPLRTGLAGAKFRLSAPASLSFTQPDKYIHTHSWGYQLLDGERREPSAHFTQKKNHAFINTFTHPLPPPPHPTPPLPLHT